MTHMSVRISAAVCALALIVGCGQVRQSSIPPLSETRPLAGSGSLLYVLGKLEGRKLSVYSFPGGAPHKHILMPTDGWGYLCSDKSGNVYVPAENVIFKYAHGGQRPIAYLQNKGALGGICASDPKTGSLLASGPGGSGCWVELYVHARGKPTCLNVFDFNIAHPSYDDNGDLFFYGYKNQNLVGELPAGASKVVKITLNKTVTTLWGLQWDGTDIAILGKLPGTIDQPVVIERFHISETKGTIVKTIRFDGWTDSDQHFWISGNLIIAPLKSTGLGIWNYPQGGKSVGSITMTNHEDWTVSAAP